ncbi:hypothetical protein [Microbispora hainanensis]|uniref:hypothetical protein n=1 Tax=Microbispora hainanensis TaxID=568844 RepID=UPI0033E64B58
MITPPKDCVRPLPIDLIEGPTGLLYLIPYAPLTLDDCDALSAVLAARVAATRKHSEERNVAGRPDQQEEPTIGPDDAPALGGPESYQA